MRGDSARIEWRKKRGDEDQQPLVWNRGRELGTLGVIDSRMGRSDGERVWALEGVRWSDCSDLEFLD